MDTKITLALCTTLGFIAGGTTTVLLFLVLFQQSLVNENSDHTPKEQSMSAVRTQEELILPSNELEQPSRGNGLLTPVAFEINGVELTAKKIEVRLGTIEDYGLYEYIISEELVDTILRDPERACNHLNIENVKKGNITAYLAIDASLPHICDSFSVSNTTYVTYAGLETTYEGGYRFSDGVLALNKDSTFMLSGISQINITNKEYEEIWNAAAEGLSDINFAGSDWEAYRNKSTELIKDLIEERKLLERSVERSNLFIMEHHSEIEDALFREKERM